MAKKYQMHGKFGKNPVQPDWNQNDPTASDYVKNRPFCADDPIETVLLETTYTATKNNHYLSISEKIDVVAGEILYVEFDGVSYECEVFLGEGQTLFGNGTGSFGYGGGNDEPFCFWNAGMIWLQHTGAHTIKIHRIEQNIYKINKKFINGATIAFASVDSTTGGIVLNTDVPTYGHCSVYSIDDVNVPYGAVRVDTDGTLKVLPIELYPQYGTITRLAGSGNIPTTVGSILIVELTNEDLVTMLTSIYSNEKFIEVTLYYNDCALIVDAYIVKNIPNYASGSTVAPNGIIYTVVLTPSEIDNTKCTLEVYCKG